jgi:hypothetical protein
MRKEPVTMNGTRFVDLDVHADSIAVAVAEARGEVRSLGTIPNDPEAVRKLVRKLGLPEPLRACHRAGPCGDTLYWQLTQLGVAGIVVAPTLVPVNAGDRIKTERRALVCAMRPAFGQTRAARPRQLPTDHHHAGELRARSATIRVINRHWRRPRPRPRLSHVNCTRCVSVSRGRAARPLPAIVGGGPGSCSGLRLSAAPWT